MTRREIPVDACQVPTALALITLAFVAADVIGFVILGPGGSRSHASFRAIDFRAEGNITTFYSALVLLAAAAAALFNAYGIPRQEAVGVKRYLPGWRTLAVIFVYLAFDEAAQFHEQVSRFGPHFSEGLAFLGQRSWVVFYVPLAAICAVAFIPFLRRLSGLDAALMIMSGIVYVFGAVGLELVGSWQLTSEGLSKGDMIVALRAVAEEASEIFGVILFIRVALANAARQGAKIILLAHPLGAHSETHAQPGLYDRLNGPL